MKGISNKLVLTVLVSLPALAQTPPQDYGDLVPDNRFNITHQRTNLLEGEDVSNYTIRVTPTKETFEYKVNSVRTPRRLFGSRNQFKLEVEKKAGKIERISSISYNTGEGNTGSFKAQSSRISENGYVGSLTSCEEDYRFNILGGTHGSSGVSCLTVTQEACDYLDGSGIDAQLVEDFKVCTDILAKFGDHQKEVMRLTKREHNKNVDALSSLDRRVYQPKHALEVPGKSMLDIGVMVHGLGRTIGQCNTLKEKNFFQAPASTETPPTTEGSTEAAAQ